MKRGIKYLASIFVFVLTLNLIRAEVELSELLGDIDQSVVILVTLFLITFSLIFFALKKSILKSDPGIAGVVAAMLGFLMIYGVNKMGLDVGDAQNWLVDIGFTESTLALIIFVFVIAGIIYLMVHFAKDSLFIIGGGLIVLAFFSYQYKATFVVLGAILLAVRIFALNKPGVWDKKPKPTTP